MAVVRDEHGSEWEVRRGDPAWEVVSGLVKQGFRDIRLPVGFLLGKGIDSMYLERLVVGQKELHKAHKEDEVGFASFLLDRIQLYDCCAAAAKMVQ